MVPIYATEAWWWAARPLWVLLWSGVFDRHPGLSGHHRGRSLVAADIVERMDEKWVGGHNTASSATSSATRSSASPASTSAPTCSSAPHAERYEIRPGPHRRAHAVVGQRLPASRGHLAAHPQSIHDVFHDVPSTRPRRCSGSPAAEVYRFDSTSWPARSTRIGPTHEEVHGMTDTETSRGRLDRRGRRRRSTATGTASACPMPRNLSLLDPATTVGAGAHRDDRFPFPIPNGWFVVAMSDELDPARSVAALLRSRPRALPHRGGEPAGRRRTAPTSAPTSAVGGKVEGDCIRCPFHGWTFDGDSRAVRRRSLRRRRAHPAKARHRPYPTIERGGAIWAWHHLTEGEPFFELPVVPRWTIPAWTAPLLRSSRSPTSCQEMAENNHDFAHFQYVHGTETIPRARRSSTARTSP
jgi:nitrite reductase/ring-hydroxylating ferredoxin subunit